MIIEAEQLAEGEALRADVCVIGAGAAGITLARELERAGRDVIVLESGGTEYEPETQALYQGEIAGRPYFPLHVTRLRMLGGTTNHWGGFSRMLDPLDFERRDWVPMSGWPLTLEELRPFYTRAHQACELGPPDYSLARWEDADRPRLPLEDGPLRTGIFQNSTPTRFGEKYRDELAASARVRVLLHASALEIGLHADGAHVERIEAGTLTGRRFPVQARHYVLAAGGIENPRLLLLSDGVQRRGIGNGHDLVGRCFMEHPTLTSAELLLTRDDLDTALYHRHTTEGIPVQGFVTPAAEVLRERRMLNCGLLFVRQNWSTTSDGARAASRLFKRLGAGELPDDFLEDVANVIGDLDGVARAAYQSARDRKLYQVHFWGEQTPNRDSRIILVGERDALGKRRVRLDWRLSEQDWRNFVQVHRVFAQEVGRLGLGRLRFNFDPAGDDWPPEVHGSHHHMGTTRMADDPRQGVVDRNGRVHGVDNLYVAGSSVFPTSGHATPTLTIVALAIRLAEHLGRAVA